MGKLLNGPYGPITGTTGNITSYMLNGQNITRMVTHARTHTSVKQYNNEMRMKVINTFFYYMKDFLKAGFGNAAKNTTKNYYNLATAYNKMHALKSFYPDVEMDYPNVLLSNGDLLPAENAGVSKITEGLEFTWDTDGQSWGNGNDQVMVMAYFPAEQQPVYTTYGARRLEGRALLSLPQKLMELPAEIYISFVSPDRSKVAKSIYLGQV
jgi:hypothetical protein